MIEEFKVYIDRLRSGDTQKIEGAFAPSFLEVAEAELQFKSPVIVQGEAYLADDHLILLLNASTHAEMPCAICNQATQVPLSIQHFYHTEPVSEIRSAVYDCGIALREALLLELPRTAECGQGRCAAREAIMPYMQIKKEADGKSHFPFADIN